MFPRLHRLVWGWSLGEFGSLNLHEPVEYPGSLIYNHCPPLASYVAGTLAPYNFDDAYPRTKAQLIAVVEATLHHLASLDVLEGITLDVNMVKYLVRRSTSFPWNGPPPALNWYINWRSLKVGGDIMTQTELHNILLFGWWTHHEHIVRAELTRLRQYCPSLEEVLWYTHMHSPSFLWEVHFAADGSLSQCYFHSPLSLVRGSLTPLYQSPCSFSSPPLSVGKTLLEDLEALVVYADLAEEVWWNEYANHVLSYPYSP